jgi:hypothetical protein
MFDTSLQSRHERWGVHSISFDATAKIRKNILILNQSLGHHHFLTIAIAVVVLLLRRLTPCPTLHSIAIVSACCCVSSTARAAHKFEIWERDVN